MRKEQKARQEPVPSPAPLDPVLAIPYQQLREIFPDVSDDKWLELKDLALDYTMTQFKEFVEQVRRHSQVDPDFNVKIGGLVTVLDKVLDVFKIQRAIIEELKEAVSSK